MKYFSMKYLLGCLIFITVILGNAQSENLPLPHRAISLNVAGFLQMGPVLQLEQRIVKSNIYLAPYVRYPYAGLIYQIYATEQFEKKISPATAGIGLQFRAYKATKMGAWYGGLGTDYSFGKTRSKDNAWVRQQEYLWTMATVGVRWRNAETKKIISMGIILGPNVALNDKSWYDFAPNIKTDERSNFFLAMVEVSFGLERR